MRRRQASFAMERYGRVLWESARWEHDQLNIIAALFLFASGAPRLALFASSDQITLISSPMISLVRYPRLLSETPDTLAPRLPGAEATPPLPRVSATCQADGALSC